jgi:DNA methylase
LRLDAGVADHVAETVDVRGEQLGELFRRARCDVDRLRRDLLHHLRRIRRLDEFLVQLAHDLGWRAGGRVIMDPPYNVPIRRVQGRGRIKHGDFVHGSGEQSPAQFTRFLRRSLSLATKYSVGGVIHFVFMDWRHMSELLAAGAAVYSELKNMIVWVKTNAGQGSFYRSQHELIFAFKHGDAWRDNAPRFDEAVEMAVVSLARIPEEETLAKTRET